MFEWFISFIVSAVISWLLAPDLEDYEQENNDGALLNKQSNNAQIPVIYGERKVGGTRVFVETSGSDNEYQNSTFEGNPQTFVTTVGLYDSSQTLVAVGRLSKPIKKNFNSNMRSSVNNNLIYYFSCFDNIVK